MGWMGRATRGVGRGAKAYGSLVMGGAKGALGRESLHQTKQMLGSAVDRMKMQTCPRCIEVSMVSENGMMRCTREDICGLSGTPAEIEKFSKNLRIDPRVIALAKGFSGSFEDRARGVRTVSRLLWGFTALIMVYAISWVFSGQLWTATWTLVVGLLCALQAVRYAYTHHRLVEPVASSPKRFLLTPSGWLV